MATLIITTLFKSNQVFGQQTKNNNQVSLLFGLNQPIVTNGFNFEINYYTKHFLIDYSHGFGLEFTGNLVSMEAKEQHLSFNIPQSVGIGFGYRFTKNFNVRIEPKMHVWEMYYNDEFKTHTSKIKTYTTYTVGLGAYYRWTPFAKKDNVLKGFTVAPSFRWWPNVGSTLNNNKFEYYNQITGRDEIHTANNIGISNSPFFLNVSVGYTFGLPH